MVRRWTVTPGLAGSNPVVRPFTTFCLVVFVNNKVGKTQLHNITAMPECSTTQIDYATRCANGFASAMQQAP